MEYKTAFLSLLFVAILGYISSVEGQPQSLPICSYLNQNDVQIHANANSNVQILPPPSSGPGIFFTLTPYTSEYSIGQPLTATLTTYNLGSSSTLTSFMIQAFDATATNGPPQGQWSTALGGYTTTCGATVANTIFKFGDIMQAESLQWIPNNEAANNVVFRATVEVTDASSLKYFYFGIQSNQVSRVLATPCSSSPCLNGGVCTDSGNTFTCACPPAWNGNNICGVQTTPCNPDPCKNGGTCTESAGTTTYSCQCPGGWMGPTCEKIDICHQSPCENGGFCFNGQLDNQFICDCSLTDGYAGAFCQDRYCNPNDTNPCGVHGTCIINHQSLSFPNWECDCNDGSTLLPPLLGETCPAPPVQNHCDPPNTPCGNGRCFQAVDSYFCICPNGSEGLSCPLPNPCDGNPCINGDCAAAGDSFTCTCNTEWTKADNSEICDVEVVVCVPLCSQNGQCMDVGGNVICECDNGWTGEICDVQVIACDSTTCVYGQCQPDESCMCDNGWMGIKCDVAEPTDACTPNPCVNGSCETVSDSYSCNCDPGFMGTNCDEEVPPDACSPACVNGQCVNGMCQCESGWEGNDCSTEIVTCALRPSHCNGNGECQVLASGLLFCICNDGYTGDTCLTGPCDTNPCMNGGVCQLDSTVMNRGYTCQCADGYTGDTCQNNRCFQYDCGMGTCKLANSMPQCNCNNGYSGDRCEMYVCDGEICLNGGTCNVNSGSGWKCTCTDKWVGNTCQTDVDECLQTPDICVNGVCTNLVGSFLCNCTGQYYGDRCQHMDIDNCVPNPCVKSLCVDLVADYQCVNCASGSTGKNCSNEDHCLANPMYCDSKGSKQCINTATAALCVCNNNYKGNTCTEQDNTISKGKQTSVLDNLPIDIWWLALIGLIVLLFVIFIIIVICTQCCSTPSDEGKYLKTI